MDHYAVFGNPIGHSRSPFIHQQFALQTQQTLDYQAIEVELDDFAATTAAFFDASSENGLSGQGANVTVPFKERAFEICNQVSERAKKAGAVNTLIRTANGDIHGDNTDGVGLVRDLLNKAVTLAGKNILLLGAGGAARGVIEPLLEQSPTRLVISNRTLAKAQGLAEEFQHPLLSTMAMGSLDQQTFDVIINATSAGLSGKVPSLPVGCLTPDTVCYDMVYLKDTTPFNRWAQEHGVQTTFDGLGMLVEQAAESFSLWRGVTPDSGAVLAQIRAML
ncbi:MAG: shikimate dehydrogenase [Phenylobacterium sp.]|jgi:shikimate dehydrogenase